MFQRRKAMAVLLTMPTALLSINLLSTAAGQDCEGDSEVRFDAISKYATALHPRRIVVLTAPNRQDRLKEHDLYAEAIATHLRSSRLCDVVLSNDRICAEQMPMRTGQFDERELLKIGRRYNADCVLYCLINSISAYDPMQMNASFLLISIDEAVALCSGTTNIDLRAPGAYHAYANAVLQSSDSFSIAVHPHMPSRMLDWAGFQVAQGISGIWLRPAEELAAAP